MALLRIGAGSTEATTITIPANHQAGDLLIIFAFRDGSTTNPTVPAGWTTLTNTLDGTTCSASIGWKIAISNADTSGTWTNTTGLVCHVYRGQATNKTPLGTGTGTAGTASSVTYGALTLKCPGTSWVVGLTGHRSIDTSLETPPSGMTNETTTAGATAEYAGHDTNAVYTSGAWPSTSVAIGGTASGWITFVIEIFSEQMNINNYMAIDTSDGISMGEKIR